MSPTVENETIYVQLGQIRHGMEWLSNKNGLDNSVKVASFG